MTEARRIAAEALPAGPLAGGDYLAETLLDDGELLQIIDENAVLARFEQTDAGAWAAEKREP